MVHFPHLPDFNKQPDFGGIVPVTEQIKDILVERDKEKAPIERKRYRAILIVAIIAAIASIVSIILISEQIRLAKQQLKQQEFYKEVDRSDSTK